MRETVTIDKEELEELKERLRWLDALEQAGVDNWEGCSYASQLFDEDIEDNQND